MKLVETLAVYLAPGPCKFINILDNCFIVLIRYALKALECCLNQHVQRAIQFTMLVLVDDLLHIDGLADLDELLDGFILRLDDREYISALALAHCGVH